MKVNEEKIRELVAEFRTAPTKEKEEELMLYAKDLLPVGTREPGVRVMAYTAEWFTERFGEPLGAIFARARFSPGTHPRYEEIAQVGRDAAYRRDTYPYFGHQKELVSASEGWSSGLSKSDIKKIKKILGRSPSVWEVNIAQEELARELVEIAKGNRQ